MQENQRAWMPAQIRPGRQNWGWLSGWAQMGWGRLERELERGLWVIPRVRSSIVRVQVKYWSKPQDGLYNHKMASIRLVVPTQSPYQQPGQLQNCTGTAVRWEYVWSALMVGLIKWLGIGFEVSEICDHAPSLYRAVTWVRLTVEKPSYLHCKTGVMIVPAPVR